MIMLSSTFSPSLMLFLSLINLLLPYIYHLISSLYIFLYFLYLLLPYVTFFYFLLPQVDVTNAHGCTPLHVACNNGQDVVVDVLLQHKATINQLNIQGQTPLHYAAWSHHGALCMELLVKAGADPNVKVIIIIIFCFIFDVGF